jgi:hypothetical protein
MLPRPRFRISALGEALPYHAKGPFERYVYIREGEDDGVYMREGGGDGEFRPWKFVQGTNFPGHPEGTSLFDTNSRNGSNCGAQVFPAV